MDPEGIDRDVEALLGNAPAIAVVRADGDVKVVIFWDEGRIEEHPLPRAGKGVALRFAVGEPGRRGTVWRLWANRDKNDVYVSSRMSAGDLKVSLHQTGDWRLQFVKPEGPTKVFYRGIGEHRKGRVLDQWSRPAPNRIGWVHALSIVMPESHISIVPEDTVKWDDVRWCPAPGPGTQVELEIKIVTPNQGFSTYRDLFQRSGGLAVVDGLELAGGDVALVLAILVPTSDSDTAFIERCEAEAQRNGPTEVEFDRSPSLAPRSLVHSVATDGTRRYFDLKFIPSADRTDSATSSM